MACCACFQCRAPAPQCIEVRSNISEEEDHEIDDESDMEIVENEVEDDAVESIPTEDEGPDVMSISSDA